MDPMPPSGSSPVPGSPAELIGRMVGKYRIVEFLGEGGMAQVFVGEDTALARRVAIKVILREHCRNQHLVDRFMNEARALGRISHPGVVDVIDVARLDDGRVCLIMEYLDGQDLFAFQRQHGRLSFSQALPIMLQLADTLGAAHDQKIVHRDLKPENIFVIRDVTTGLRTKVLDFGIAKLVEGAGSVATATKTQMGTAAYMPPEQFQSSRSVDHRSDIYALGCVFFEMLGGRPPFVARTLIEHMRMHAYEPPPRLSAVVPEVPPGLDELLLRMLAKDREQRFGSMAEVRAALEAVRDGRPLPAPTASAAAPASGMMTPKPLTCRPGISPAMAPGGRWALVAALIAVVIIAVCVAAVALS